MTESVNILIIMTLSSQPTYRINIINSPHYIMKIRAQRTLIMNAQIMQQINDLIQLAPDLI